LTARHDETDIVVTDDSPTTNSSFRFRRKREANAEVRHGAALNAAQPVPIEVTAYH
jgi:hypothetical protein